MLHACKMYTRLTSFSSFPFIIRLLWKNNGLQIEEGESIIKINKKEQKLNESSLYYM